mgnify:CR=1 FL=1
MADRVEFRVNHPSEIPGLLTQIADLIHRALKAGPVLVILGRDKRSDKQNKLMWALLRDISRQVRWHGMTLTDEDWKHVISAEIEQQRLVPGINTPFVALGVSTRRKSKAWFSDFFEQAWAFGAEQGVEWSGKTNDYWMQVAENMEANRGNDKAA